MQDRSENGLLLAWLVALGSSLVVIFIGEVMGQAPCFLCWLQRAFMFPLAVLLGLGVWWRDVGIARYGSALALFGGAIALWHLGVFYEIIPEAVQPCTVNGPSCAGSEMMVLGVPIPLLAALAFGAIAVLLNLPSRRKQND